MKNIKPIIASPFRKAYEIKRIIKSILKIFNLKVGKIPEHEKNKFIWLKEMNIKTIFDIGANKGKLSEEIHKTLPYVYIYAFEPLESCYKELVERMQNYERFKAFKIALGNFDGETNINMNDFLPSSSLLEIGEIHKKSFPLAQKSEIEKITIRRLDRIVEEYQLPLENNVLVKIDVQGYENKVIIGGKNILSKAKVIITETSFTELYKGQPSFDEIYNLLKDMGFKYAGCIDILFNPQNGIPLQSDSVFIKENS